MIKVTSEAHQVCVAKAREAGQSHLFAGWDELSPEAQRSLVGQLEAVDFQLLSRLIRHSLHGGGRDSERQVLKPPHVERLPSPRAGDPDHDPERYARLAALGEEALRQGKVRLVMVSGGPGIGPLQEPVGFLPVGPVSGKSVFQLQAEKIRALTRRYRTSLRWTIVVHPDHLEQVRGAFKKANHFGLASADTVFLAQPLLPLIDKRGKLVLTEPGQLALRPNGHGGVLLEFLKAERLDELERAGVEHLFFFQADNPLVKIADPVFLGYHIESGAEVTSKGIRKLEGDEEVGVFCQTGGMTGVVEYSELQEEEKHRTLEDGTLAFSTGNMAVHLFSTAFFRRMVRESIQLPFHTIERAVPCVSRRGRRQRPTEPNCIEFRCYLFDVLWKARESRVVEVEREEEFSPIKNPGGANSPQTAQRHLSRLYARWLRSSGANFRDPAPEATPAVEISPLYALDEEELRAKLVLPFEVGEGTLLDGRP